MGRFGTESLGEGVSGDLSEAVCTTEWGELEDVMKKPPQQHHHYREDTE